MRSMVFIEISSFTQALKQLLSDDEYRVFQQFMLANPLTGDVIQGTGGLRKVRWSLAGQGKRGGVRVIYYHSVARSQILLVMIYPKSRKDDLNKQDKADLKKIVEKWNG